MHQSINKCIKESYNASFTLFKEGDFLASPCNHRIHCSFIILIHISMHLGTLLDKP
jgi:hypothetical protein